jgi:hypothetical protein
MNLALHSKRIERPRSHVASRRFIKTIGKDGGLYMDQSVPSIGPDFNSILVLWRFAWKCPTGTAIMPP